MFLVHGSVVKNRTPVVFVEGTGGCCDLFAKCYHLYNGHKSKEELSEEIKTKIRATFRIVNHELDELHAQMPQVKE